MNVGELDQAAAGLSSNPDTSPRDLTRPEGAADLDSRVSVIQTNPGNGSARLDLTSPRAAVNEAESPLSLRSQSGELRSGPALRPHSGNSSARLDFSSPRHPGTEAESPLSLRSQPGGARTLGLSYILSGDRSDSIVSERTKSFQADGPPDHNFSGGLNRREAFLFRIWIQKLALVVSLDYAAVRR